jgi:Glycosyl hydrolases family 16
MDPVPTPSRPRRGLLLLVAGTVAALLVGTFVVVLVARSGARGAVTADSGTGPAGARPSTTPGGEQAAAADSASPSPSATGSPSPRPTSPTPAAARSARDDFTAATLDKTKWAVYGTNGQGSYEANMVRVSGGELQVLGVGNNPTAAANHSGGLCWCVDGNHTYGSWQVRAKFDAGSGYRQVLELWPQSDSATADGSLNFASDGDAAKKVLGLVLLPPSGGGTAVHISRGGDFTAWHLYRVDWRATYVRMYVDDVLAYDSSTSTTPLTIPHTPMHLVIQQDKGPGNGIPAANAQTPAQVVMHVDWVRFDP